MGSPQWNIVTKREDPPPIWYSVICSFCPLISKSVSFVNSSTYKNKIEMIKIVFWMVPANSMESAFIRQLIKAMAMASIRRWYVSNHFHVKNKFSLLWMNQIYRWVFVYSFIELQQILLQFTYFICWKILLHWYLSNLICRKNDFKEGLIVNIKYFWVES